jgi:class 3 adenylate cyclase
MALREVETAFVIADHAGPVVEQDGAYFGPALNVTARVADHARPGQILGTRAIVERVPGVADRAYRALGPVRFKNVAEPVEVFEVVVAAAGAGPDCARAFAEGPERYGATGPSPSA